MITCNHPIQPSDRKHSAGPAPTKFSERLPSVFILSVGLTLLGAAPAQASDLYTFATLNSPSYPDVDVAGINNSGEMVGTAWDTAGRPVAFRYASGAFYIYPSPGPSHSTWGYAINNAGTIVGLCDRVGSPSGSSLHDFYATRAGSAVDFDSDPTRTSVATAIVAGGYVIGNHSSINNGTSFLGNINGWSLSLNDVIGDVDFNVTGLNDSLLVVGNGQSGGVIYDANTGKITYLGLTPGFPSTPLTSVINHFGVVAGTAGDAGFLYKNNKVTIFGKGISQVSAINGQGDVVGRLSNGHAFLYFKAGGNFVELNSWIPSISPTWTLVTATGINDSGQICGTARRIATAADYPHYRYVYRAYVLTKIPYQPAR